MANDRFDNDRTDRQQMDRTERKMSPAFQEQRIRGAQGKKGEPKNQSLDLGTPGETKRGFIKRLVADKGFGFIRTDNGQEWFFHRSACKGNVRFDDLNEGDIVQFVAGVTGPKGLRGEDVEMI